MPSRSPASVAQFFNITPNHLSKLFAQHGTMRFIEYVRWVRMAKARMILQNIICRFMKWRSVAGFRIATILSRFPASVWSDAGRV